MAKNYSPESVAFIQGREIQKIFKKSPFRVLNHETKLIIIDDVITYKDLMTCIVVYPVWFEIRKLDDPVFVKIPSVIITCDEKIDDETILRLGNSILYRIDSIYNTNKEQMIKVELKLKQ